MFKKTRTRLRLVALLTFGALLGTGCSSSKHSAPVLDNNATLASLTVSAGTLTPAFSPAIHAYTLSLYTAVPSITVTPATGSAKATLTVQSVASLSGQASAAIALVAGTPKVIPIKVVAEDTTVGDYTLTVTENAINTDVCVTDSINGSPVKGAVVQVADAAGNELQGHIAVDASGHVGLGLPPTAKYSIFAMASNSAQSSLVNFDPSKETAANLYCHPLGMINFAAAAPQITKISYSENGTDWKPVDGNQITDTWARIAAIRVTAVAKCGISPAEWAGFGIGLNVDHSAWSYDYLLPYETTEKSVPVSINGLPYYQTTASFGIPLITAAAGEKHFVDVVVYDVANNRTEQKLYLNVTDATPSAAADKDISTYTPGQMYVQLTTFGLTRDTFSMGDNVTYQANVQFSMGAGAAAPGLRGYEVWRSSDATNFTKVATVQFGSLDFGTNGTYSFVDNDPALDLATTYTYKVRGFTANTSTPTSNLSQFSLPLSARFLAAHTVSLTAPALNEISLARTPIFSFTNSTPALFSSASSDYYRFYLFIKDKVGNTVYSVPYRYNWLYTPAGATAPAPRFEKKVGTSYVDASSEVTISKDNATISIQFPTTSKVLVPGMTYEWSIFGTAVATTTTNANAASFLKYYPSPTGTTSVGVSYGSTPELSYGAINGFFTLTIDPAAK